jgi:glycosyltransferase involved in cell wall biosynthesis
MLAVRRTVIGALKSELAGSRVQVVERSTRVDADLVYRPYQMLYARELPFVTTVGRRGLVGQLDMIGFSNPFYHPSDQLFFFARNLQRHLMRTMDGVTFISAFGRDSAFTECPDLDVNRLHVVSCGADPKPLPGVLQPDRPIDSTTPFLVCLSSTFWHKNRAHAIATFAALVEDQGYEGHLVLGGPEPYFGRSTDAEDVLLQRLALDVQNRVHRWGHIDDDEKWWLLRHAQVVLYPSIVEGFGLVPFEAASVGTPCLTYAGTAPGELLAGTDAVVVNSWSPATWAIHVSRMISDTGHASDVVNEIAEVAKLHTWKRCAERTWIAVDEALAAPRRSIHHDDGHFLSRVAPSSQRKAPGAALRFDIARGLPAVGRRLKRARNKVGGRT